MALLLVSACGSQPGPATATEKRAAPDRGGRLPLGIESMYALVNEGNLRTADDLLRDVWRLPRHPPVTLPARLTWREDPYIEQYWRFVFYGLRPTSHLLWAYRETGDGRYRDKLLAILRDYAGYDATDRPLDRRRLDDKHASAFRAMVLVNSYVKLARTGDLPADLRAPLERSIAKLGRFLADPRNFEGTYNHGFTEAAALLLVTVNFPDLPGSATWRSAAEKRLGRLMEVSVDRDGVEVEKSPFYHFYVFNFALEVRNWAARNDISLPARFASRVESMVRHAAYVLWPDGTAPLLGSSVAMTAGSREELYADLYQEHPELQFAVTGGRGGTPPADRAALFAASGQAILRSRIDAAQPYRNNSQVLVDVGPPQTGHSHLEALGLNYYSGGRVLLPDSGVYTYEPGAERTYFRGTSAHNTVVVDGRDQDPGPIRAGLTRSGPDGWAYQSGMSKAYPEVTHTRAVLLLDRDLLLVADTLRGTAAHDFNQLWHLFPGARLRLDGLTATALDERGRPALRIVQAPLAWRLEARRYFGERSPMQGWYSDRYERKRENHVVGYATRATGATFLTLVASDPYASRQASVTGRVTPAGTTADVCTGAASYAVTLGGVGLPGESVTVKRLGGAQAAERCSSRPAAAR